MPLLMNTGTHNFVETPSVARDSTVCPVPMLWAGQYRVQFLVQVGEFSVLQNIQSTAVAHPAYC